MSATVLFLASASPRRRELLKQIGVACAVVTTAVDESVLTGEPAETYVARLAKAKARAGRAALRQAEGAPRGAASAPPYAVLGADTAVLLDAAILGKPADRQDALRMLGLLSGRTHEVLTAVALTTVHGESAAVSRSRVTFRAVDPAEAARYWATGEPRDKAGAYGIQGFAAVFVTRIEGSHSGVMGLPLAETAALLDAAGVARWA